MQASFATFLVRKLIAALAVIAGASALTFATFRVLKPESFDDGRPLPLALLSFLERAFLHFDPGRSRMPGHREVSEMVLEALPADVSLLAGALVIGTVAGLSGGAVCAIRPRSALSRSLDALAALAVCAPVYWVGLMSLFVSRPTSAASRCPCSAARAPTARSARTPSGGCAACSCRGSCSPCRWPGCACG